MSRFAERAFIGLQYLLPQHFLSGVVRWVARTRIGFVRTVLIRSFLRHYPVDLSEAARGEVADYASFNDFFTRRLRAGARVPDPDPRAALCPVDGAVSQAGAIEADTLLQAKGLHYPVAALLGGDAALAAEFAGGAFLLQHAFQLRVMSFEGSLTAT